MIKKTEEFINSNLNDFPYWSLVAIIARCARRLQPLIRHANQYLDNNEVNEIISISEALIESAEQASMNGLEIDGLSSYDIKLYNDSVEIYNKLIKHDNWNLIRAFSLAQAAHDSAQDGQFELDLLKLVIESLQYTVNQDPTIVINVIDDILLVQKEAIKNSWNDRTIFPIAFFGDLWPNGEPEWFRSPQILLQNIKYKGDMYDIAFSFAGEDRTYVQKVAEILREKRIKVFYDAFEQTKLWGKNLYTYLKIIYSEKAKFTVVFCSKYYAGKMWTTHELESAQIKALKEKHEYILPVRFDNTKIPGIMDNTAYIDLKDTSPKELAMIIIEKIKSI